MHKSNKALTLILYFCNNNNSNIKYIHINKESNFTTAGILSESVIVCHFNFLKMCAQFLSASN
jgi:hypothetical protein